MSVARHLNIDIDEYDERIRTFVPGYERLVSVAARAMELTPSPDPTVLDLGIGTGALSAACLAVRPDARIVGIDADPTMLEADAPTNRLSGGLEYQIQALRQARARLKKMSTSLEAQSKALREEADALKQRHE